MPLVDGWLNGLMGNPSITDSAIAVSNGALLSVVLLRQQFCKQCGFTINRFAEATVLQAMPL